MGGERGMARERRRVGGEASQRRGGRGEVSGGERSKMRIGVVKQEVEEEEEGERRGWRGGVDRRGAGRRGNE